MKNFLQTNRTKPESVKRFLSSAAVSELHEKEQEAIGRPVSRVNLPGYEVATNYHGPVTGMKSSRKIKAAKSSMTRALAKSKSRETKTLVSEVVNEVLDFKPSQASKIALEKIFHTVSAKGTGCLDCRETDKSAVKLANNGTSVPNEITLCDHKRHIAYEDVLSSKDCLESAGLSANREKDIVPLISSITTEKLGTTSDCRETGEITKELSNIIKTDGSLSNCYRAVTKLQNNNMSSCNKNKDCRKTDKLVNKSTNTLSSFTTVDEVLNELEAILPDILEIVMIENFSRKKLEVSRKNKLYRKRALAPPMNSKDLAKKLREMADAIDGVCTKTEKMKEVKASKAVKPVANKPEAKLISLMGGEHESRDTTKVVLADLKVRSKVPIPYSDIKNILIKIFKFKPGEFSGITRAEGRGGYSFLAYEPAVRRCCNSGVLLEQGGVFPWTPEDLSSQVALAATVCSKAVESGPNKRFKKVASFYLKSLDGDIPCILGDIIMSMKVHNE